MSDFLTVFDAWKSVSAENLSNVASKLKGKQKAITFTTCYPGQEGKALVLGSVEGNLHFLLGYVNPAFHLAVYHWQVVDPALSDEEARELHRVKGHPSLPELWKRTQAELKEEGDLEEGDPHPSVAEEIKEARAIAARSKGIQVKSGIGSYTCLPEQGLVYGNHNKQTYLWSMVRDTFFAAANPEVAEQMNAVADVRLVEEQLVSKSKTIPDTIMAKAALGISFNEDVYPLVKTHFPTPGSILSLTDYQDDILYGVITEKSLRFYTPQGQPASVQVYGYDHEELDLIKGGDTHPSILYSFGITHLGLSRDELDIFAHTEQ